MRPAVRRNDAKNFMINDLDDEWRKNEMCEANSV